VVRVCLQFLDDPVMMGSHVFDCLFYSLIDIHFFEDIPAVFGAKRKVVIDGIATMPAGSIFIIHTMFSITL